MEKVQNNCGAAEVQKHSAVKVRREKNGFGFDDWTLDTGPESIRVDQGSQIHK